MENVTAEAPEVGQGEMEANPRPEPSASRTTVTDAAVKAPPIMAAQDTAETGDSMGWYDPASEGIPGAAV
jgi:hypothetical protein